MLGTHNLPLFLIASIALTLIPGPATMYILGRSIAQGRTAGVMSVLGIGCGSLCHTLAVAFGLSALLTASQPAFWIIKIAGAAYLIFLGVQALRSKAALLAPDFDQPQERATAAPGHLRIFGQGALTQLLNPKVTLFFIALLPQFVRTGVAHSPIPFLALGTLFVTLDTAWFLIIACGSAWASCWLRRSARFRRALQRATGALYIGLGLNLLRAKARLAQ